MTERQLQRNLSHIWRFPYRDIVSITQIQNLQPIIDPTEKYTVYGRTGEEVEILGERYIRILKKGIIPLSNDELKHKKYAYLMLREFTSNSETLRTYLERQVYNYKENLGGTFYLIMFQIAIACYAMELLKITHNDFHDNNIMIEYLNHPSQVNYTIYNATGKSKTYSYYSNIRIVVFDFDRAYRESIGKNILLDTFCEPEYGYQCNKFIKGRDIVQIYCKVIQNFRRFNSKFIKTLTDDSSAFKNFTASHIYCTYDKVPPIYGLPKIIENLALESDSKVRIINKKSDIKNLFREYPDTSYVLNPKNFTGTLTGTSEKLSLYKLNKDTEPSATFQKIFW